MLRTPRRGAEVRQSDAFLVRQSVDEGAELGAELLTAALAGAR